MGGREEKQSIGRPVSATVYTSPGCVRCSASIKLLNAYQIPICKVVDVSTDEAARERLRSLGFASLPVVELSDGRSWSGHRDDQIRALGKGAAA